MSWIKIEYSLLSKPEVMAMAERFGVSEYEIAGHLVAFWCWVDCNVSLECPRSIGTKRGLDRVCGREGMVDALIEVGWLAYDGTHFSVPNLDRHLSRGAKQRSVEARKKQEQRKRPESVPDLSRKCPDGTGTKTGLDKRREEKTHTVSSLPSSPPQNTEPPFPLLSCNRGEWAEIGECTIPPSLSVFQNEVFAWVRHLRSMRGPNFDPNELQLHLRDAVKLGRRFPISCDWSIRYHKDKLAQPKQEPEEIIDFEMWHKVKLAFDAGGNNPRAIREQLGETAFEAWVKLARTTLKEKIDDQDSRRAFAAEFVGNTGTELAGRYFQCLKEACSE